MILALDVGGTFIKWAAAEGYELKRQGKVPTPQDTFDHFLQAIQQIMDENNDLGFEGIAMSYPGMEDPVTKTLVPFGALTYGLNQPVRQMIEDAFHLPLSFENDGRLAALAEARLGNLKGIDRGYVLVIGTGIGGAYVKDGKIDIGSHGYAGQISLFLIDDLRKKGLSSIWSASCGMPGFLANAKEQLGMETLDGETFMSLVREGNPIAVRCLDAYMDRFTNVLFSLQMLEDPDRFVIGGGISADDLFIKTMQRKYEELYTMFGITAKHADIVACKYHNTSNLLGALVLYDQEHGLS